MLTDPSNCFPSYKQVWCSLATPKHIFFFWLAVQQKLFTRDRLVTCIPGIDMVCPVCNQEEESNLHLFFQCVFSKQFVNWVCGWLQVDVAKFNNWLHWFYLLKTSYTRDCIQLATLQAVVYLIWTNRSTCIFSASCSGINFFFSQVQFTIKNRIGLYKKKNKQAVDNSFLSLHSLFFVACLC